MTPQAKEGSIAGRNASDASPRRNVMMGSTMKRRNLLFGLLAVTATISGARAEQSGKARRIAIVVPAVPVSKMTETSGDPLFQGLFNELRHLEYVEGQNLLIERYSGEGRASQYAALARDVVSRNPDLIIALTNNLVLDFKAATTAIPIVGVFAGPVEDWDCSEPGTAGRQYHRGLCRCRARTVGQADSIVAAGRAEGDQMGVARIASSARAVGDR